MGSWGEKKAQLQNCPKPACPGYTGTLEREYLKPESFSTKFYLASTQLITVHLGKFYKNLRQLVAWFKHGQALNFLLEKF